MPKCSEPTREQLGEAPRLRRSERSCRLCAMSDSSGRSPRARRAQSRSAPVVLITGTCPGPAAVPSHAASPPGAGVSPRRSCLFSMTNAVPWEGPPAAAGPVMPSAGSGRTDSSAVRSDAASCGQPSRSPPGWGSAPGPARSRAPGDRAQPRLPAPLAGPDLTPAVGRGCSSPGPSRRDPRAWGASPARLRSQQSAFDHSCQPARQVIPSWRGKKSSFLQEGAAEVGITPTAPRAAHSSPPAAELPAEHGPAAEEPRAQRGVQRGWGSPALLSCIPPEWEQQGLSSLGATPGGAQDARAHSEHCLSQGQHGHSCHRHLRGSGCTRRL